MTLSRVRRSLLIAWCALAALAPNAGASGRDLWIECRDKGAVGTNHSPQDYADAIAGSPGDAAEYTGCLAMIKAAQTQAALGVSGGAPKPAGTRSTTRDASGGDPSANAPFTPAGPASAATPVTPESLGAALKARSVDPAAYPEATPDAAPPARLGGDEVQLAATAPTFDRALSLPLPVGAAALVVLLSAAASLTRRI